ncbi:MAG: hypothetical protein K2O00_00995 [Muribaculaceae bacterium]|nr:hypothetical protein [Muribaculaceae bacterium]
MYRKVVNLVATAAGVAAVVLSGCDSADTKAAGELVSQASQAVENRNSTLALSLLDSLQHAYPAEIEQQREGMKLRPRAMELSIMAQIQTVDSVIAVLADTHHMLSDKMKTISSPELVEAYQTPAAGYNANFINTTGVQPRVDRAGQFYLVSSMNPGGISHESLTFISGSDEVTTEPVPYDGELNYHLNGSETVTFMPAKSDTIGSFMVAHRGAPVSVRFNGAKGKSHTIKLTQAQTDGMADAYQYSQSVIKGRDLTVERERLDRQLQVARDQQARLNEE